MRAGVAFPVRHPHEAFHVDPLRRRLADLAPGPRPAVAVHADTRPPVRGAWNVQLFHGLGDKQYTANPIYLQKGRFPRARTAASMVARRVGLRGWLAAPARPSRRACRYQQVNAYGPRLADRLEAMLSGTVVSRHGHVALNETTGIRTSRSGPVLWLPTWDNRAFMGGLLQSSLGPFADAMAEVAERATVWLKPHPLTVRHGQDADALRRLEAAGVQVVGAGQDPYALLQGVQAVVTDTSSLGFEAAACGVPVVVLKAARWRLGALHDELEAHVPAVSEPDARSILDALREARRPAPRAWRESLLYPPGPGRNDRFAGELRDVAGRARVG